MAEIKVETKLLDEYIDKGLVIRKGIMYTYNQDGTQKKLATSKAESETILKEILGDKQVPASPENLGDLIPTQEQTPQSIAASLQPIVTPEPKDTASQEKSDLEQLNALVSEIVDIKPNAIDDLDILYKGISVNTHREKFLDFPKNRIINPVFSLPIIFVWLRRGGKDNAYVTGKTGMAQTCNGYQVFLTTSKLYKHLEKDLTIFRNDASSDGTGRIINGDLILCIAKKTDYDKVQQDKVIKALSQTIRRTSQQRETRDNFAKYDNPEKAVSMLAGINRADADEQREFKSKVQELQEQIDSQ
jgi:hypothetical protein